MDSAGDVDSGFDRLGGGLLRSVDQRGGGGAAATVGDSRPEGERTCARGVPLMELMDSEPDSEGEGDFGGGEQEIGGSLGLGFAERNVSSQPETISIGESGDGEGIVNRDEKRVENPSERWMNSSSPRDLWNNDVCSQRTGPCRWSPVRAQ